MDGNVCVLAARAAKFRAQHQLDGIQPPNVIGFIGPVSSRVYDVLVGRYAKKTLPVLVVFPEAESLGQYLEGHPHADAALVCDGPHRRFVRMRFRGLSNGAFPAVHDRIRFAAIVHDGLREERHILQAANRVEDVFVKKFSENIQRWGLPFGMPRENLEERLAKEASRRSVCRKRLAW